MSSIANEKSRKIHDAYLVDFPFFRRPGAKAYVNDPRYEFEFESEVTRRTWNEFPKYGIKARKVLFWRAGTVSQVK